MRLIVLLSVLLMAACQQSQSDPMAHYKAIQIERDLAHDAKMKEMREIITRNTLEIKKSQPILVDQAGTVDSAPLNAPPPLRRIGRPLPPNGWEYAEVETKRLDFKDYLVVDLGLSGQWLVEKPFLLRVFGGTYLVKPALFKGIDAIIDDNGDKHEFLFEEQTKL
jgi:hypothetical protein